MMNATCTPIPVTGLGAEQRTDHLGELLTCLSELLVDTAQLNEQLARAGDPGDARARGAIARLAEVQQRLYEVSCEAASVHQQLQHVHLV